MNCKMTLHAGLSRELSKSLFLHDTFLERENEGFVVLFLISTSLHWNV
jgi:hypothetical protein